MHLGNGAITPECVAITLSAASAGLGLCAWSAWQSLTRSVSAGSDTTRPSLTHRVTMAAGLGAFIFAAQAVNVPILPGVSAHLVGGVLLAWALGPALGSLTMALVLALQALLLGDGGPLALGANIINMALIPAALVAIAQRAGWLTTERTSIGGREVATVAALSAAAVVLAAGLIVVEVALFKSGGELAGWTSFAQQMVSIHLLIGLTEGAATGLIVAALASVASPAGSLSLRPALVTAVLAILTALAVPFSSELPDGYEYAANRTGQTSLLK